MMKIQVLCFTAAATAALFSVGCGSSDASPPPGSGGSGGGSTAGACATAVQQFPGQCDAASRTCYGIQVPSDEQACNECLTTAPTVGQDPSAPLTQCSCENCAIYLAACFESATREGANGDAQRDQLCRAIVDCGQAAGCQGVDCYVNADLTPGPCAAEIDAAAEASEGCAANMLEPIACALQAQSNPASAVMRASEVGACVQGDSTAMPPVVGNCEL